MASPADSRSSSSRQSQHPPRKPVRSVSRRACLNCREKKIKCDGVHKCRTCRANNLECVFVKSHRGGRRNRKNTEAALSSPAATASATATTSSTPPNNKRTTVTPAEPTPNPGSSKKQRPINSNIRSSKPSITPPNGPTTPGIPRDSGLSRSPSPFDHHNPLRLGLTAASLVAPPAATPPSSSSSISTPSFPASSSSSSSSAPYIPLVLPPITNGKDHAVSDAIVPPTSREPAVKLQSHLYGAHPQLPIPSAPPYQIPSSPRSNPAPPVTSSISGGLNLGPHSPQRNALQIIHPHVAPSFTGPHRSVGPVDDPNNHTLVALSSSSASASLSPSLPHGHLFNRSSSSHGILPRTSNNLSAHQNNSLPVINAQSNSEHSARFMSLPQLPPIHAAGTTTSRPGPLSTSSALALTASQSGPHSGGAMSTHTTIQSGLQVHHSHHHLHISQGSMTSNEPLAALPPLRCPPKSPPSSTSATTIPLPAAASPPSTSPAIPPKPSAAPSKDDTAFFKNPFNHGVHGMAMRPVSSSSPASCSSSTSSSSSSACSMSTGSSSSSFSSIGPSQQQPTLPPLSFNKPASRYPASSPSSSPSSSTTTSASSSAASSQQQQGASRPPSFGVSPRHSIVQTDSLSPLTSYPGHSSNRWPSSLGHISSSSNNSVNRACTIPSSSSSFASFSLSSSPSNPSSFSLDSQHSNPPGSSRSVATPATPHHHNLSGGSLEPPRLPPSTSNLPKQAFVDHHHHHQQQLQDYSHADSKPSSSFRTASEPPPSPSVVPISSVSSSTSNNDEYLTNPPGSSRPTQPNLQNPSNRLGNDVKNKSSHHNPSDLCTKQQQRDIKHELDASTTRQKQQTSSATSNHSLISELSTPLLKSEMAPSAVSETLQQDFAATYTSPKSTLWWGLADADAAELDLPPFAIAQLLVDLFYSHVHPAYPLLPAWNDLLAAGLAVRAHCALLHAMFALSCRFLDSCTGTLGELPRDHYYDDFDDNEKHPMPQLPEYIRDPAYWHTQFFKHRCALDPTRAAQSLVLICISIISTTGPMADPYPLLNVLDEAQHVVDTVLVAVVKTPDNSPRVLHDHWHQTAIAASDPSLATSHIYPPGQSIRANAALLSAKTTESIVRAAWELWKLRVATALIHNVPASAPDLRSHRRLPVPDSIFDPALASHASATQDAPVASQAPALFWSEVESLLSADPAAQPTETSKSTPTLRKLDFSTLHIASVHALHLAIKFCRQYAGFSDSTSLATYTAPGVPMVAGLARIDSRIKQLHALLPPPDMCLDSPVCAMARATLCAAALHLHINRASAHLLFHVALPATTTRKPPAARISYTQIKEPMRRSAEHSTARSYLLCQWAAHCLYLLLGSSGASPENSSFARLRLAWAVLPPVLVSHAILLAAPVIASDAVLQARYRTEFREMCRPKDLPAKSLLGIAMVSHANFTLYNRKKSATVAPSTTPSTAARKRKRSKSHEKSEKSPSKQKAPFHRLSAGKNKSNVSAAPDTGAAAAASAAASAAATSTNTSHAHAQDQEHASARQEITVHNPTQWNIAAARRQALTEAVHQAESNAEDQAVSKAESEATGCAKRRARQRACGSARHDAQIKAQAEAQAHVSGSHGARADAETVVDNGQTHHHRTGAINGDENNYNGTQEYPVTATATHASGPGALTEASADVGQDANTRPWAEARASAQLDGGGPSVEVASKASHENNTDATASANGHSHGTQTRVSRNHDGPGGSSSSAASAAASDEHVVSSQVEDSGAAVRNLETQNAQVHEQATPNGGVRVVADAEANATAEAGSRAQAQGSSKAVSAATATAAGPTRGRVADDEDASHDGDESSLASGSSSDDDESSISSSTNEERRGGARDEDSDIESQQTLHDNEERERDTSGLHSRRLSRVAAAGRALAAYPDAWSSSSSSRPSCSDPAAALACVASAPPLSSTVNSTTAVASKTPHHPPWRVAVGRYGSADECVCKLGVLLKAAQTVARVWRHGVPGVIPEVVGGRRGDVPPKEIKRTADDGAGYYGIAGKKTAAAATGDRFDSFVFWPSHSLAVDCYLVATAVTIRCDAGLGESIARM